MMTIAQQKLFELVTQNGIAEVLCDLEVYCKGHENSHRRNGEYRLASNWQVIGVQIFKARQEAMKRQLTDET